MFQLVFSPEKGEVGCKLHLCYKVTICLIGSLLFFFSLKSLKKKIEILQETLKVPSVANETLSRLVLERLEKCMRISVVCSAVTALQARMRMRFKLLRMYSLMDNGENKG